MVWIIAKYAKEGTKELYFPINYQFSIHDSAHDTYSGLAIDCPSHFDNKEDGIPWLRKMREFNPTVGYDLVEIDIE